MPRTYLTHRFVSAFTFPALRNNSHHFSCKYSVNLGRGYSAISCVYLFILCETRSYLMAKLRYSRLCVELFDPSDSLNDTRTCSEQMTASKYYSFSISYTVAQCIFQFSYIHNCTVPLLVVAPYTYRAPRLWPIAHYRLNYEVQNCCLQRGRLRPTNEE